VRSLDLCATVDFSMLDQFATAHDRDLRNMREHAVDYFNAAGSSFVTQINVNAAGFPGY
jgi:hypothetical protein